MALRASRILMALIVCALLAPQAAAAAGGGTGGATAGGAEATEPPRASQFLVAPARLRTTGGALTVHFRVEAATAVRAGLALTRRGARRAALRMRLGWVEAGRPYTRTVRVAPGRLARGAYVVSLLAVDAAGRRLRTATASGPGGAKVVRVTGPAAAPTPPAPTPAPAPAPAPTPDPAPAPPVAAPAQGVFPVQGPWTFGGEGSRFGAGRTGHTHQGQDIAAAAGTPVVAPVAGTVTRVAFQASGAGHYVVLHAGDGRDMVFMHFQAASPVAQGTAVPAGALIGRVGSSGGTSSGPHLHFEIWPDGWYAGASSRPIDPLPALIAWAGTR